ncbi:MAG: TfpX/TfpZ family type IV pilin accessory protein [Pseudomonadota bacterium]
MTRFRGFLLHFAISAAVVGVALAVIYFVWYPDPYFRIIGTWEVVRVMVGVDLVLGPLLTLIFYKPGKPKIRLDLSIIAVVQLAALIYALTTIYKERPAYLVFAVDRLNLLADRDVERDRVPEQILAAAGAGPLRVVARLPEDPVERSELMFSTLAGGKDIEQLPRYWVSWEQGSDDPRQRLNDVAALREAPAAAVAELDALLARTGLADADVAFLPVVTPRLTARSLVLERRTLEIVGVVTTDPWALPGYPPQ